MPEHPTPRIPHLVRYLGEDGCQAILEKLSSDEATEIIKWRRDNDKSAAETVLAAHDGGDLERRALQAAFLRPFWLLGRIFGNGPTYPPGLMIQRSVEFIQKFATDALAGMADAEFDLLTRNEEVPWMLSQHHVPSAAPIEPKFDIQGLTGPKPNKSGRRPGNAYREADRPLVERIIAGMQDGLYKNRYDGALALAKEVVGNGKIQSKVQRLLGRIQSGQYGTL
jgi:hypothetical protein